VHAILAKRIATSVIHQLADLFGNARRQFLAAVELRPGPRQPLTSLLALLDDVNREIDTAVQEIDREQRPTGAPAALSGPRHRQLHRDADHRRNR
jgi:hypothetical protein